MENLKEKFAKIYDQYIDKIYRFVFLKVNSREVAEDLTAETFLRGWKVYQKIQNSKIKNEKEIENPQAFLYQIARNLITDHYREKGKRQLVSADCVPIADPRSNIEEKTQFDSDLEMIKTALANLENDDYQNMVILYYIEDLSVPEIAEITGKSETNVRVIIHRALKALRKKVEEMSSREKLTIKEI